MTSYRIKSFFLVQELSKILWGCTQHALLLKVLDSPLWFLVEPVWIQRYRTHCSRCCITVSTEGDLGVEVCVENSQVNALLDDLLLLFEDLKLLWVVGA